jgi:hypothetical protein
MFLCFESNAQFQYKNHLDMSRSVAMMCKLWSEQQVGLLSEKEKEKRAELYSTSAFFRIQRRIHFLQRGAVSSFKRRMLMVRSNTRDFGKETQFRKRRKKRRSNHVRWPLKYSTQTVYNSRLTPTHHINRHQRISSPAVTFTQSKFIELLWLRKKRTRSKEHLDCQGHRANSVILKY